MPGPELTLHMVFAKRGCASTDDWALWLPLKFGNAPRCVGFHICTIGFYIFIEQSAQGQVTNARMPTNSQLDTVMVAPTELGFGSGVVWSKRAMSEGPEMTKVYPQ